MARREGARLPSPNEGPLWSPSSTHAGDAATAASAVPVVQYEACVEAASAVSGARTKLAAAIARDGVALPIVRRDAGEPWWAFLFSWHNLRLSGWTFAFYAAAVAFHMALASFTYGRGVRYGMHDTPPLHDLLHELLPHAQSLRVIPEVGFVAPVLWLSGLMLVKFDQRSLDCFRTFLWTHGCLLAGRALSFVGTLLPDASEQCRQSVYLGSCHDLVYSGHVSIMLLSALFACHFFEQSATVRTVLLLTVVVVSILIVACRNHYTVDVVLALGLTTFAYVAFTRHPALVALGTAAPAHVLAKGSTLNGSKASGGLLSALSDLRRDRGTVGGGRGRISDGLLLANRRREHVGGYALLRTESDLQLLTDHAHAAVRCLGLSPRLAVRVVSVAGDGDDDHGRHSAGRRRAGLGNDCSEEDDEDEGRPPLLRLCLSCCRRIRRGLTGGSSSNERVAAAAAAAAAADAQHVRDQRIPSRGGSGSQSSSVLEEAALNAALEQLCAQDGRVRGEGDGERRVQSLLRHRRPSSRGRDGAVGTRDGCAGQVGSRDGSDPVFARAPQREAQQRVMSRGSSSHPATVARFVVDVFLDAEGRVVRSDASVARGGRIDAPQDGESRTRSGSERHESSVAEDSPQAEDAADRQSESRSDSSGDVGDPRNTPVAL